jgi:hypothetical protein
MMGALILGYKDYGPSNGFDRGAWLFVITVLSGLGPLLFHHLSWVVFFPICIIAGVWGATTRNLNNKFIAPVSGLIIVSFIWFIHG